MNDVTYDRERTRQDRLDAQALMRAVFVDELGWDSTLPDRWDRHSVYVLGRQRGRVFGALRVVAPDAAGHLPISYLWESFPRLGASARPCELGRLAVHADCRGRVDPAEGMRAVLAVVKELGVTHLFVDATPEAEPLYRLFGFRRCPDGLFNSAPGPLGSDLPWPGYALLATPAQLAGAVGDRPGCPKPAARVFECNPSAVPRIQPVEAVGFMGAVTL